MPSCAGGITTATTGSSGTRAGPRDRWRRCRSRPRCAPRVTCFNAIPRCCPNSNYTSSFDSTLATADRGGWVSAGHFGLDQGIVVMIIENHRTQLIWRLMQDCPYVGTGLRRAGFRGGWL
ncbi:MAG: glucoamylase family protein [Gammaproteobacteria bacterium]